MTTTNQEVYDAFIDAGASPDKARAAAAAVMEKSDIATKRDLVELEMRLTWRMIALQGLTIAILKLIL